MTTLASLWSLRPQTAPNVSPEPKHETGRIKQKISVIFQKYRNTHIQGHKKKRSLQNSVDKKAFSEIRDEPTIIPYTIVGTYLGTIDRRDTIRRSLLSDVASTGHGTYGNIISPKLVLTSEESIVCFV